MHLTAKSFWVAGLLFGSGLAALVYQVVWLRELRLVFGASTPATAAVLAVFMAGLGYGSLLLSRRADKVERPLRFYAHLELLIAAFAGLSSPLLWLVRKLYIALGGSVALGWAGGTVVRLALTAIVLLPPTLAMGGTLPAAARAAMPPGDTQRRSTALLYGVNTLGAVTGVALSTFVILERLGAEATLLVAVALNVVVGLVARAIDRGWARTASREEQPASESPEREGPQRSPGEEAAPGRPQAPARGVTSFVLVAAAGVGFSFLVMELVWYRVLSPLLGGSSYTFGLILAVALGGVGLGGLLYSSPRRLDRRALLYTFAITCVLEALCLAIPYALGDRVAIFALVLRGLGAFGFWGYVVGWTMVAAVVVLPAAIVAGYQFPLLIAMLGEDVTAIGEHVGRAYAFNTAGAIVGSLAGGFFLIPALSALGAWQLAAWVLLGLGATATWLAARLPSEQRASRLGVVGPAALGLATLLSLYATTGPTAVWRHSPIGAGRADDLIAGGTAHSLRAAFHERRRAISWMVDGRESSIGLYTLNDVSFIVNGKSDGAAVNDGGTQVMGGLLGALLQPEPVRRALVIGLGSGSTAGWLGTLPDLEQVDAVELEPKMREVAAVCAPVNQDVLNNDRVHLHFGDAREVLLTTPNRYDLIFSEPSNPYRAGVASLFTREFYQAARARLAPGGVFIQWLQAYEIDAESLRLVYATLASVFPSVETWRTKYSDLILLGREGDVPVDLSLLRARIKERPYREALRSVWRVDSVEGVLSHFVARSALARDIAERAGPRGINTDDKNALEYSIARALGRSHAFSVDDLLEVSKARGELLPDLVNGTVEELDEDALYGGVVDAHIAEATRPYAPPYLVSTPHRKKRYDALLAWHDRDNDGVLGAWRSQPRSPTSLVELMVVADALAVAGEEAEVTPLLERLGSAMPIEAQAIRGKLRWAQRRIPDAWAEMRDALVAFRDDPWPNNHLMSSVLAYLPDIARAHPELADEILDVLSTGLAMHALHYYRIDLRLDIGLIAGRVDACMAALEEIGPHFPWEVEHLNKRVRCLELAGDVRVAGARADLAELEAASGAELGADLGPPSSSVAAP